MGALAMQFPEMGQNISLMSNGYIYTVIPVTLLSGWLTNSGRLKYKVATFVGSVLMLIGGVGPALLHTNFWVIFALKLVFGIGLGLLTPLANALILNLYEGDKRARYTGWVTLLMNFGGILFQMIGGFLVDANGVGPGGSGWYMHFWAYALCVVPVVLSFFIPEPEIEKQPADAPKVKEKLGSMAIIAGCMLAFLNLLNFPVMMYMSNLFMERGIGGDTAATAAATALSLFTVAGVVSGALFGRIFKILKRFVLAVGFIGMAIGIGLVFLANNAVVASCGTIVLGFAFSMVMPAFMMLVGMRTSPSRMTLAISITMALMNLGALIVTFYLQILAGITGEGLPLYNMILILAMCGFAVLAIVFVIWNVFPKAPAAPPAEG
ncbi:MAG: MFS transporter [Eggerthellaceae bacterium]|nr:MFS transporter [Eggerthellaceae bacterium]